MVPASLSHVSDSQRNTQPGPVGGEEDPSAESQGSGIVKKMIVGLLIVAAVGFAAWKIHANVAEQPAADGRPAGGGDRAIPIVVAPVQQKIMPIYLTELGTVTAYYSVTIKSRVDGQLMSVNVSEGQAVHKGQLLAVIDPGPYKAALAQAEGQLAKDKATADYAKTEADRYKALYNAGVVSQDSAQTLISNAGQTAGSLQADQAAIQAAAVNLAYTRITSPIDGVVGLRQVDPGNIVHAADATGLILVTQLQPIAVIFTLPEDQLPQVRDAMAKQPKLAVEAYDRSETLHLATGKLLTLDNQIDTTTGTDKVKAVFDNKDRALFPNQFVNVRLILEQRPDTLVIPSAAVQSGAQGTFVYVMKHGDPSKSGDVAGGGGAGGQSKRDSSNTTPAATSSAPAADGGIDKKTSKSDRYYVEVRPIVIDVTEGAQVIVSSGLKAGDQVVVDGQEKLKNGSRVAPQQGVGGGGSGRGGAGGKGASAGAGANLAEEGSKVNAPQTAGAQSADEKTNHHQQGQHP
jgi:multidrug efflux system membrane fusion protein